MGKFKVQKHQGAIKQKVIRKAEKRARGEDQKKAEVPLSISVTIPSSSAEAPRIPRNVEERKTGQRAFVVLEKAPLELVHVKGRYELMNADDHKSICLKHGRDLQNCRPDITHQCLMSLLDSPLNKAGKLWIYVHTSNNVLIEIHPSLRIPRTFKRFAGLMVELLQRNKIKAVGASTTLMKVVSNPVTKYLPEGGRKVGLSVNGRLVNFRSYVDALPDEATTIPPTFVVGAVAHGDPLQEGFGDWVEEQISISNWGLSASNCCTKITNEFEFRWGVL